MIIFCANQLATGYPWFRAGRTPFPEQAPGTLRATTIPRVNLLIQRKQHVHFPAAVGDTERY